MDDRTWKNINFDWNQARAFLVTAEAGSLSAAARALGLTQPTMGRQVAALEDSLGITLFERVGKSLSLTAAGLDLLAHVKTMGEAAGQISLVASGQSQAVEGQVVITASDIMAAYHLPSILEELREQAPGITIEVVASNEIRDLKRREADIAIRHVRPEQPDLIAKQVPGTVGRFYATPAYFIRHGRPETVEDLADAVFVGFGDVTSFLKAIAPAGLPIDRRNIRYASNSGIVAWEMVKQGLGMCIMSDELGDMTPGMERVLPEFPEMPVPFWLVTHRELRTNRRIRVVFDFLSDAFKRRNTGR
ncbi:MAG: LysR family transcriptional regulator [Rhodospirillaceae bacterium]|nr:LysR family transcriptional regulator [Rhodospirillaceae bacterium]|tara:strand:+ start:2597 stop:3508 length:912 start_codon:yes stop_codon:yes gene_type:complete